jgi:Asp-tRNA(Asn)/Glu-tRNA(Gln) amidotransferase A subunit family amidase
MKHGDDTFNELTQVCDIPVELVDSGSSSGSFVAVALAAVAAGLGIGLYLKRK